MAEYQYNKASADLSLLTVEVNTSQSVGQTVDHMDYNSVSGALSIFFAVALSEAQQSALASLVSSHDASVGGQYERNIYKRTPQSGPVQKEEWWNAIDGETCSGIVWRRTYTYSSGKVSTYKDEEFFKSGDVMSSITKAVFTDSGNNYIEKRVT